MQKGAGNTLDK